MKTFTGAQSSRTSFLAITIVVAICLGITCDRATAGCTNYENYLHWVSRLDLPHDVCAIHVQDDYAYIAESGGGAYHLKIADITNESSPVVVSSLEMDYPCLDVAVSGTIAALPMYSTLTDGLYLIDVSNPLEPAVVGSALPGHRGTDVVMTNTMVYMVHSDHPEYNLTIVDITDPANPVPHPSVPLPTQPTDGLILRGDYIYVGGVGLMTVNVADPSSAYVADCDEILNRSIRDIALNGDYIHASTRHITEVAQLTTFSLANPSDPQAVRTINSQYPGGGNYPHVAIAADVCYYGYSTGYIYMFDVSDPYSTHEIGHLPHPGQWLSDLAVFGPNLYNLRNEIDGDHGYIHTISVSSPSPLEPIGSVDTPGDALDVAIAPGRTDLAYVADGAAGVQIVDVTDPLNPVIIDVVDTPGFATDIELIGTNAYVADGDSGLQVIDVTTPAIIGSVDTPGTAVDLVVVDTLAYVADSAGGLRIIDIADPSLPVLRGVEIALLDAQGVAVLGGVAYVADGAQGVQSVDVSDPDNPWIIDGVKHREATYAKKVDVVLDRAYVTDETAGLMIVDVSDPWNLAILSDLATDHSAGDVNLLGLFAFVGSGAGMRLIDVQDGANPLMVGGVEVPATARGIFANENYAYIAAGSAGLQVCPTQCGFDEAIIAGFTPSPAADFYPVAITFNNDCVGYGMSYIWDFGDSVGTSTEKSPTYTYTEPGDYTVTLEVTNGTNTEVISTVVSALAEPATLTSMTDIPDDQGGYVYLNFYHSGYDDDGLSRSEMYTVQRLDDDVWVSLHTIGAYGEHYYNDGGPDTRRRRRLGNRLPHHCPHGRGQLGQ